MSAGIGYEQSLPLKAYLLVGVFGALHTNELCCGLEFAISRLDELVLEGGVVLDVSWLVDSALNVAGG